MLALLGLEWFDNSPTQTERRKRHRLETRFFSCPVYSAKDVEKLAADGSVWIERDPLKLYDDILDRAMSRKADQVALEPQVFVGSDSHRDVPATVHATLVADGVARKSDGFPHRPPAV